MSGHIQRGSSGVVLFVHGAGTPAEVAFDVPYSDYSWMAYLANAGFDVFSMDLPTLMVTGVHDKQVLPARVREYYEDLGAPEKVFIDLGCSSHNAMREKNHLLLFQASLEWFQQGTVNGAKTGTLKLGYDKDGKSVDQAHKNRLRRGAGVHDSRGCAARSAISGTTRSTSNDLGFELTAEQRTDLDKKGFALSAASAIIIAVSRRRQREEA